MTCDACAKPQGGVYMAGCAECNARRIARSLLYARAEASGRITAEYREALESSFGEDWMAGHRLVKGARARDCAL